MNAGRDAHAVNIKMPPFIDYRLAIIASGIDFRSSIIASALWDFLPIGFLLTIAIETAVLLVGLSARHRWTDRLLAGVWLTACTYPIVVLVLPSLLMDQLGWSRPAYLVVAETFAPLAECVLFWLAYVRRLPVDQRATARDFSAIVVANLLSFGLGLRFFG